MKAPHYEVQSCQLPTALGIVCILDSDNGAFGSCQCFRADLPLGCHGTKIVRQTKDYVRDLKRKVR